MGKNWVDWHAAYDDPNSSLHQRLALVQRRIRDALDAAPPGQIRVISMCAGQGRDLLGVLADHPRRTDVMATLVELNPDNVDRARQAAAGLNVTAIAADAGDSTPYADAVPADLLLVCGVFGNISDDDIRRTVAWLPRLCRPGATVIWTRHRRPPDLTVRIRQWFTGAGFAELGFDPVDGSPMMSVGAQRLTVETQPFEPGVRLFEFVPEKV
jgi:Methyltransferase domain